MTFTDKSIRMKRTSGDVSSEDETAIKMEIRTEEGEAVGYGEEKHRLGESRIRIS